MARLDPLKGFGGEGDILLDGESADEESDNAHVIHAPALAQRGVAFTRVEKSRVDSAAEQPSALNPHGFEAGDHIL